MFRGGSAFSGALSAFSAMMKAAPNNCPPVQQAVLPTSIESGYVISTRNSRTTGRSAKDDAPKIAATTYEGMILDARGVKISPM